MYWVYLKKNYFCSSLKIKEKEESLPADLALDTGRNCRKNEEVADIV